jgi:hypothetical protein
MENNSWLPNDNPISRINVTEITIGDVKHQEEKPMHPRI